MIKYSFGILYFKLIGEYFLIIYLFLITEIELADVSVGDGVSPESASSASVVLGRLTFPLEALPEGPRRMLFDFIFSLSKTSVLPNR